MKSDGSEIEKTIVGKVKESGASQEGIAAVDGLKASPSHEIYDKKPFHEVDNHHKSLFFGVLSIDKCKNENSNG